MFETLLQLHEIKTEGGLIMNVVHIYDTRMIEAGIYGLSIGNDMGITMQVIYLLQFIPIYLVYLERSKELEGWIMYWCGSDL